MSKVKKYELESLRNNDDFASEIKVMTYNQPFHWHDFFEIEYVIEGSGEYIINGISHKIKNNTLFFSTPVDFQEIYFKTQTKILNIQFSQNVIDHDIYKKCSTPVVLEDIDRTFLNYLNSLIKYGPQGKYMPDFIKHMLNATLVLILRNSKPLDGTKKYAINNYFYETLTYVNNHFTEHITLSFLAKRLNIAPEYLSRLFHDQSGQTLMKYISELRLNYTYNLISNTKTPISEISANAGYNSLSHFTRTFNSKFGISPRALRKQKSSDERIE